MSDQKEKKIVTAITRKQKELFDFKSLIKSIGDDLTQKQAEILVLDATIELNDTFEYIGSLLKLLKDLNLQFNHKGDKEDLNETIIHVMQMVCRAKSEGDALKMDRDERKRKEGL